MSLFLQSPLAERARPIVIRSLPMVPMLRTVPMLPMLLVVLMLLAARGSAGADPVVPPAAAKERPVTLEAIPGSPNKRVTLSARAAERLDIQLGKVDESAITATQMFGAIAVDPSSSGVGAPAATPAKTANAPMRPAAPWIRVAVSPSEWSRLDKTKPVRVFPLETRPNASRAVAASPVDQGGRSQQESSKSGMVPLYYAVQDAGSGLVAGSRVRIELPLEGGAEKKKTVPYAAVYYDAKGDAWVYVNSGPFAYARERVAVERVIGDLALLTSGPAVGTPVVIVGVSLLYGAEMFGK